MENLILNWRYSENGIQFFAKSKYIENLMCHSEITHIINSKNEYIGIYENHHDLYELYFSDTEFYNDDAPNLSFLRLVGLSDGVYFEIKNKKTNGIVTKKMIENYINNVKNHIPKLIRSLRN